MYIFEVYGLIYFYLFSFARIEHLPQPVLELFPKTIFGKIKPKICCITTPNQEYNVLFENFEGPFRHGKPERQIFFSLKKRYTYISSFSR